MAVERVINGHRIRDVLNQLTGRRSGVQIDHSDGRVSAVAAPECVTATADDLGVSHADLSQWTYHNLRELGDSHELALLKMKRKPTWNSSPPKKRLISKRFVPPAVPTKGIRIFGKS